MLISSAPFTFSRFVPKSLVVRFLALALPFLLTAPSVHAQWLTQTITLKPGWNAVYLFVDASYQSLDQLIPDANGPIEEIWLWKPTLSSIQFVSSPQTNTTPNSQWAVWTASRGDTDSLTTLVGNAAYLVNNRTTANFTWTVKGKPVPPSYRWSTTGLNFFGFPTPANSPPSFQSFLSPNPSLDLAKFSANGVHIFRYPGGPLASDNSNPMEVTAVQASSTSVNRGEAYWVEASTNYFNSYYGPVSLVLQDASGLNFADSIGTYKIHLKNLTSTSQTMTFTVLNSEAAPSGQTAIFAAPSLLLRGPLSSTTLTYSSSSLNGQQVTVTPQGQIGSELDVFIGLNRSVMTGLAGSLYAGVLRVTDGSGLSQNDFPVSATMPASAGLWVGSASINQVGEYLKQYPTVNTDNLNSILTINNAPLPGQEFPGATWVAHETNGNRPYVAVASSLNGASLMVAGAATSASSSTNRVLISGDSGNTWTDRTPLGSVLMSSNVPAFNVKLGTNFIGSVTKGGFVASFDLTVPLNGGGDWAAIILGGDSAPLGVNAPNAHFGVLFRDSGTLQAFDGGTVVSPTPEPGWSLTPNIFHHIDIVCTDPVDGNPFDGANSTKVEIFVDGSSKYSFTKSGGGYRSNFLSTAYFPGNLGAGLVPTIKNLAVSASDLSHPWTSLASSGDGQILIAAPNLNFIQVSTNAGLTWIPRASTLAWAGVACSADGSQIVAVVNNGNIWTSGDTGVTWTSHSFGSSDNGIKNWTAVSSSSDGSYLLAANKNGLLYTSYDSGATWTNQATSQAWASVASSANGSNLVAAASAGIYLSADAGNTWTLGQSNNTWTAVAISTDGQRIAVATASGNIFQSLDGGATWAQRAQGILRSCRGIACSGDASQLVAVENPGSIFTLNRSFASYVVDPATGIIRSSSGAYLTNGIDTHLGNVSSPFPLRLILHQGAGSNPDNVKLLQHVFVGPAAPPLTNTIVATMESLLDPANIGSARRISATHLPFSTTNAFWSSTNNTSFTPGASVNFLVSVDYRDQANNPFLHTFHPDHDNLDANFANVLPIGVESYGISRQIILSFTPRGSDFNSLTASLYSLAGAYAENLILTGRGGFSRTNRVLGTFTLQRISPIATLSTP